MTSMSKLALAPKLDFRKFRLFLNCFVLKPMDVVTGAEGIFFDRQFLDLLNILSAAVVVYACRGPYSVKHMVLLPSLPLDWLSHLNAQVCFSVNAFNSQVKVRQISSYFWVLWVLCTHMSSKTKWPEKIQPYHFSLVLRKSRDLLQMQD